MLLTNHLNTIIMKKELNQLYTLVHELGKYFDDSRLITISVLIQNCAFNTPKWGWKDYEKVLSLLKKMADFRPDCHISQWAYTEARMIIDGHFMSEDEEKTLDKIHEDIFG